MMIKEQKMNEQAEAELGQDHHNWKLGFAKAEVGGEHRNKSSSYCSNKVYSSS